MNLLSFIWHVSSLLIGGSAWHEPRWNSLLLWIGDRMVIGSVSVYVCVCKPLPLCIFLYIHDTWLKRQLLWPFSVIVIFISNHDYNYAMLEKWKIWIKWWIVLSCFLCGKIVNTFGNTLKVLKVYIQYQHIGKSCVKPSTFTEAIQKASYIQWRTIISCSI